MTAKWEDITIWTIDNIEVAAMSLKFQVRLHVHAYQVGTNTRSGTEVNIYCLSDWLMRSELGYFVCSLILGFNNDAATLNKCLLVNSEEIDC